MKFKYFIFISFLIILFTIVVTGSYKQKQKEPTVIIISEEAVKHN